ncbi:MAG: hypothetical protein MZV64_27695 [Ignavibacteriales bacterium]|nr:hypothetical protein [Ignavibacteriales bacterium]
MNLKRRAEHSIYYLLFIPAIWHKDFVEYIVNSNIERDNNEYFLIFNADENNIDANLLSKIFIKGANSGIKTIISTDYKSKFVDKLISYANFIFSYSEYILDNFIEFKPYLNKLNSKEALYGKISNKLLF